MDNLLLLLHVTCNNKDTKNNALPLLSLPISLWTPWSVNILMQLQP